MSDTTISTTKKSAGMFESMMLKMFTHRAKIVEIEELGPAFRIITLAGDALLDLAWTPGDKIQIQFGGWVQRTYTPMDWDAKSGRTRILVYLHSDSPGVQWARAARPGDECVFFGPRKSVRLAHPQAGVLFFGDETSLGLAVALSSQVSAPAMQMLFEVSVPADAMAVIDRLNMGGAQLVARLGSDAHFTTLEEHMAALLQEHPGADIVLTGKAATIQCMQRLLKHHGVAASRRQSKAYWATGKTGLD
ncbi:siderophore-interacting protein [Undibacterium sp. TC4M20W]|uniref:siderophore-interacting protein n=1 Tax=Undibacterium sp. TC4M20W TaxID=3413052 RepID=UPI003BF3A197